MKVKKNIDITNLSVLGIAIMVFSLVLYIGYNYQLSTKLKPTESYANDQGYQFVCTLMHNGTPVPISIPITNPVTTGITTSDTIDTPSTKPDPLNPATRLPVTWTEISRIP